MKLPELPPTSWVDVPYFTYHSEAMRAYGEACAKAALEAAAAVVGESAQSWWTKHCLTNRHMQTTRAAHDDLCALQIAIRSIKVTK